VSTIKKGEIANKWHNNIMSNYSVPNAVVLNVTNNNGVHFLEDGGLRVDLNLSMYMRNIADNLYHRNSLKRGDSYWVSVSLYKDDEGIYAGSALHFMDKKKIKKQCLLTDEEREDIAKALIKNFELIKLDLNKIIDKSYDFEFDELEIG
jgi:hypothetical protein